MDQVRRGVGVSGRLGRPPTRTAYRWGSTVIEDGRPIFVQIAEQIENSILDGSTAEGEQVPSTNELAAFHRINPATAAKGVNQLVADGILFKKRGIGMFVAAGARARIRERRRERFARQYVDPLIVEARKLGLDNEEIKVMIDRYGEA